MVKTLILFVFFFWAFIPFLHAQTNTSKVKIVSEITMLCSCDDLSIGDTVTYEYSITNVGVETMQITYPYWDGENNVFNTEYNHHVQSRHESFPNQALQYSWKDQWENGMEINVYNPKDMMTINYLAVGDTFTVRVEDVVTPSKLREGNNTIVVWPENVKGLTVPDSLGYEVTVNSMLSVQQSSIDQIQLYPNPGAEYIYVLGINQLANQVESVFVMNMNGQVVQTFGEIYEQYDISGLAEGYYTLNFKLLDNSVFAKPLIVKK